MMLRAATSAAHACYRMLLMALFLQLFHVVSTVVYAEAMLRVDANVDVAGAYVLLLLLLLTL
jgi:hypothetical protein